MTTGRGEFAIVGKLANEPWVAWAGGLDKWGPLGREWRFLDPGNAQSLLRDAERDAEEQDLEIVPYVAQIYNDGTTGLVFNRPHFATVNFSDPITPDEVRAWGNP